VHAGGRVIATMTPASPRFVGATDPPSGAVVLSRFACLRRDGGRLVLDSPLATARVEILDLLPVVVIASLTRPATAESVAGELGVNDITVVAALLGMFRAAGLVTDVDADGTNAEDRDPARQRWELADLALHQRSRGDRTDQRLGGTFRFAENLQPLAPLKPPMSGTKIELHRADLAALKLHDVSLTSAMEDRKSIRRHGSTPISVKQLGEFLDRAAGLRPAREMKYDGVPYDIRHRVYPGGGACHPLEIYVAARRCDGLAPGLYHYEAGAHALELLRADSSEITTLLMSTATMMDDREPPQLLIVLTARFGRLSWKYEGIAYALLLKEVGVVFEAMYLVATAMGLAPCAVGAGDAAHFARLIGSDPLEESSVGEFLLGSL
jgi:SagB-type dehydrogenase family enzyme